MPSTKTKRARANYKQRYASKTEEVHAAPRVYYTTNIENAKKLRSWHMGRKGTPTKKLMQLIQEI